MSVECNRPYKGSMVPDIFFGSDPNVWSVMIEVNRKLYMDEENGARGYDFDKTCLILNNVLERIIWEAEKCVEKN